MIEFPSKHLCNSELKTVELAKSFSENILPGSIIVLNGELGSGKTFFIKQLLKCFGIRNASSPTFSIVNVFKVKYNFYHLDFYRIKKASELFEIGFNDYINEDNSVILIEWGELFPKILPSSRIEINIRVNGNFSRQFEFNQL